MVQRGELSSLGFDARLTVAPPCYATASAGAVFCHEAVLAVHDTGTLGILLVDRISRVLFAGSSPLAVLRYGWREHMVASCQITGEGMGEACAAPCGLAM